MTMGPEPMIRTFLISFLLGMFVGRDKRVETGFCAGGGETVK
jgi:hypothetical protein